MTLVAIPYEILLPMCGIMLFASGLAIGLLVRR